MNRLETPQDRIAKRLGVNQVFIHDHLLKMATLPNSINADLTRGFTVSQVAEKHACPVGPEDRTGGWTEPMVWSLALECKDDLERFKELGWGLRIWDQWEWNDCSPREIHVNDSEAYFTGGDKRFGDDWPGRIPFVLLKQNAKKTTRLAFINADWRDFQNKPAAEESGKGAILIDDYLKYIKQNRLAAYPHHSSPHVSATL